ncbi:MAG: MFS transporter [Rhizomicrobium sp.]
MTVHPDGLPTPQRYWAIVTIALGIIMAVMDSAIANIALPTIGVDLHADPALSIWIVNGYQLAITVSLLPLAALGDIIGYRRIYIAGLILFTIASLLCAVAHSLAFLAFARVAQGFGGAGIMSVNSALIRFIYPHAKLGRGLSINTLIVAVSAAMGPTVASAILSVGTWPWLFAVNVPFGIVAAVIAVRALPFTPRAQRAFDIPGALLVALMFGLLIGSIDAFGHGESFVPFAVEFAATIAIGFIMVRREATAAAPMLPVDLMRIPIFALSIATSICSFAGQMLALVSLPFLLQRGMHFSAVETGLLITPWPIGTAIVSPIAGRLADRYPRRHPGRAGPDRVRGRIADARPAAGTSEHQRHRVAHGAGGRRLRAVPVAQQPRDDRLGPARAQRRRLRHAGHGTAARPDHRRRAGGDDVRARPGAWTGRRALCRSRIRAGSGCGQQPAAVRPGHSQVLLLKGGGLFHQPPAAHRDRTRLAGGQDDLRLDRAVDLHAY